MNPADYKMYTVTSSLMEVHPIFIHFTATIVSQLLYDVPTFAFPR